MDITNAQKRAILEQKVLLEKQRYYSSQVDAQVAQDIGEMDNAISAAKQNMANSQKTIHALEKLLTELSNG